MYERNHVCSAIQENELNKLEWWAYCQELHNAGEYADAELALEEAILYEGWQRAWQEHLFELDDRVNLDFYAEVDTLCSLPADYTAEDIRQAFNAPYTEETVVSLLTELMLEDVEEPEDTFDIDSWDDAWLQFLNQQEHRDFCNHHQYA